MLSLEEVKLLFWIPIISLSACASLTTTRPVQQMSDTAAALRAAREVQADSLAPELFRQARELYFKARREYKFKNFKEAETLARKARIFAERSEFEAVLNGGNRVSAAPDPLAEPAMRSVPPPAPIDAGYEKPRGKYVEELETKASPSAPK